MTFTPEDHERLKEYIKEQERLREEEKRRLDQLAVDEPHDDGGRIYPGMLHDN